MKVYKYWRSSGVLTLTAMQLMVGKAYWWIRGYLFITLLLSGLYREQRQKHGRAVVLEFRC